ncbi:uncharacterized protein BX663DRAFT_484320 [Cokeromyces recurvatus]|uniref:uncharacterized protein n=1 Tax=Cokeromyces recurvatus TaxID=90255 RepID=UPI00222111AE|nr:uncharacterized protein BX663DRAFT_484320 [Cokeromyces recurvatus]KAI7904973.1 hypothetical protein BX663DRAFT_484320 [Cokeromyces recurvatus]
MQKLLREGIFSSCCPQYWQSKTKRHDSQVSRSDCAASSLQSALYKCTKIHTAYYNNVKAHFDQKFRTLLNKLFKKEEKSRSLRERMEKKGLSKKAVQEACKKEVYGPCNRMKLLVTKKKELPGSDLLDEKSRSYIQALLSTYPSSYTFEKNSIYYDVVAHPNNHFKDYYKLATILEAENMKTFICFPIRTAFIPCYITLDTKIVHLHILKKKGAYTSQSKFETWGDVVDLGKKTFKRQGPDRLLRFQGTIETDGVGVSVVKQAFDVGRKQLKVKAKDKGVDNKVIDYIESIKPAELRQNEGKYVLMDPDRRDLLFCTKETSTREKPEVLIYTKMTRSKLVRHSRILRKMNMPEMVKEAERVLSKTKSSSVDFEKFKDYIKARASVTSVLEEYYGNETLRTTKTYFPDSVTNFSIQGKGLLYFGELFVTKIRGCYPQNKNPIDSSTSLHLYATYLKIMINQKHVARRLDSREKDSLIKIIQRMLNSNDESNDLKQLVSKQLENILVIANWSAPNIKYQEPTRNKGLISMLKKNDFEVYLIDEFRTSSFCPDCESSLENFKEIKNPRPYMRKETPTVICHMLLRKLWNRDLAATLNFKKILISLRNGKRNSLFARQKQQQ